MDKLERIAEMEKQLAALKSEVTSEAEKAKRWEPEYKGTYHLNHCLRVNDVKYYNHRTNTAMCMRGNTFETKAMAEYAVHKVRFLLIQFQAWAEVVGDWRPKFDNSEWSHIIQGTAFIPCRYPTYYPQKFYFLSEEQAQAWCDMVNPYLKEHLDYENS